jgi:two-component system nitrate/nitrite sensor histidine kinase NarX
MSGSSLVQAVRNNWIKYAGLALIAVAGLACVFFLGGRYGWPLSAGLLIALAGGGAALIFRGRFIRERSRRTEQENQALEASRARLEQSERGLQALLQINRVLAESSAGLLDSSALMDACLSIITRLVGALGCSYVPIDEWRQPLPAFTHGQLPEPVLGAWSAQLASGMLRERCATCTALKSTPGACPLHPAQLGNIITVYCITQDPPAARRSEDPAPGSAPGSAPGGVLHLYLPAGQVVGAEMTAFLKDLLQQVTLAFQAARLRQQEQSTLRHLQMLRAPEGDFAASLEILLQGLVQALEADFALIRVRPALEDRLSNLNVRYGDFSGLGQDALEALVSQALDAAAMGQAAASPAESLPVWQALPLVSPEGVQPDGKASVAGQFSASAGSILLVGVNRPAEFHRRQRAILQSVAAQAALLVENDLLFHSLEYRAVIQERTRLAREIHDGLAQTLAFLKLQASQMQSYLAQGNLARLSQILKDNYQALAEAYLDTRQAIDDLRLAPQASLEQWLERILTEFENTTGLPVERDIHPLSRALAPEVQAQLVRIVQEALSNIRKHARARRVRVRLFDRGEETILEIADDGRGFDADDVPDITRHGLRGMRERAEMLGADFQIISQALQGTTMRLVLPALHATASLAEEPS